ncbi:MAG: hypothetical protein M9894_35235 [Planctomycetes bacterium]|nr:hypothetical protein [Planctomycetota bacterium]
MHWNPYIDVRVEVSRAVRATCRQCGAAIDKGAYRVEAVPILGKPELLHVDCAAKRAPDHARRKLVDKDPDWPPEVLEDLARFVPAGVGPAPRSYQRTPIMDLGYDKDAAGVKPCVYCMEPCPGVAGPSHGHAVRAFSLDGERRFHPACIVELAPGLCRRIVVEASDRWPPELKAYFAQRVPAQVLPTPRSPWRHTAGVPALEHAPSARAACRFCSGKIEKGDLRLAREQIYGMRRSPVYFHVGCYAKSDDYHPKMIELVVLRAGDEVTRDDLERIVAALPPKAEEDDDVPALGERLREIFAWVEQKREVAASASAAAAAARPKLTENIVDIPEGFFGA